ncbi:MAG TPA: hypothetical protein VGL51_08130 [Solirubrobacteraceae bacterium]|jgi:uncharacterized coiled-coil protein SlyX
MSREPEGFRARIRQIRRAVTPEAVGRPAAPAPATELDVDRVEALRARVAHLEQLVQGLQDSVYRESQRHDKRITELEERIDPAALAAALSKDARERGI